MPPSEKASYLVAGAVVGVLGVLVTLMALINQLDNRYIGRQEFAATMVRMDAQLSEIKEIRADVKELRRRETP